VTDTASLVTSHLPEQHDEVTHSDIFISLGTLTGKIEFITKLLEEKRGDINSLQNRLSDVEKKAASGAALAVLASILLPLITSHFINQAKMSPANAYAIEQLKSEMIKLKDELSRSTKP
jgi:hypothetical protein